MEGGWHGTGQSRCPETAPSCTPRLRHQPECTQVTKVGASSADHAHSCALSWAGRCQRAHPNSRRLVTGEPASRSSRWRAPAVLRVGLRNVKQLHVGGVALQLITEHVGVVVQVPLVKGQAHLLQGRQKVSGAGGERVAKGGGAWRCWLHSSNSQARLMLSGQVCVVGRRGGWLRACSSRAAVPHELSPLQTALHPRPATCTLAPPTRLHGCRLWGPPC